MMILRGYAALAAAALGLALGLPTPVWAAATPVTYCGQSIRGRGFLTADLDCTGFFGHAVIIERGRLDLKGFTIRGAEFYGVHCESSCRITGPGGIVDNGLDGVHAENWVIINGVLIASNGISGVFARNVNGGSRLVIRESTIMQNGFNGVEADNLANIRDSIISENGQYGVDVGVQFCNTGGRVILVRSTVAENGSACGGPSGCADLNSCGRNNARPRLRNASMCGTSHVRNSGIPGTSWGVCSED